MQFKLLFYYCHCNMYKLNIKDFFFCLILTISYLPLHHSHCQNCPLQSSRQTLLCWFFAIVSNMCV